MTLKDWILSSFTIGSVSINWTVIESYVKKVTKVVKLCQEDQVPDHLCADD